MRQLTLVALLIGWPLGVGRAQWLVGVEAGVARYGGSSRNRNSGGVSALRPGDATAVGVRVSQGLGRFGVAVRGSYGTPGIAATGMDLTVSDRSSGELVEVASLLAVQVARVGPSGAVRAELGPALHLWKLGDEIRSRIGAVGAVAYEWRVAARFSGAIRLEGALSKSWFDAGDLSPEYERRPTRRHGVTLGLRYLFPRQHPSL